MTLSDIEAQLTTFFCEKDVFDASYLDKIMVTKDLEENKKEMVRIVLEKMAEDGMVEKIGDYTWMLTIPLEAGRTDISISMGTAMTIANVIETYKAANKLEGEPADAFNLHEGHIIFLINIIGSLVENEPRD